ncbi:coadhesin-like [Gigantopelta aegis]|uniref:coadhesin-like n=1 Tax=Gigantopelta aegis TaxID=1735272 RepID=UPI001B8892C8|nr:coadhesin-like [Gigantopelta aegis]XP_041356406.1 coadhesin-like [Gigantopelta aegis]
MFTGLCLRSMFKIDVAMTTIKRILLILGLLTAMTASVNAQWSTWVHVKTYICLPVCRRALAFKRSCANESSTVDGTRCPGTDNKLLIEDCEGGLCTRVDGQWTAWQRHDVGECLQSCTRKVTLTRTCTDPSPGRIGAPCPGSEYTSVSEQCLGGKCLRVNGQWTSWERYHVLPCQTNCRKGVALRRTCTNPRPVSGGKDCPGSTAIVISEECDDFLCRQAVAHWAPWFRHNVGPCLPSCIRTVRFSRTCRTVKGGAHQCPGSNSSVGTEGCQGGHCTKVDGRWTSWYRHYTAPCELNCKRGVAFKRTCTNPRPSGWGKKCAGMANKHTTEECSGYLCTRKTVGGQWSVWSKTGVGQCPSTCSRTIVLTRTCTNPSGSPGWLHCAGRNTMRITEYCDGGNCVGRKVPEESHWASWTVYHAGRCPDSCERTVTLSRTCMTPIPSDGHVQCVGPNAKVIREDCTGGTCGEALGNWILPKLNPDYDNIPIPAVDGGWSSWSILQTQFDECPPDCRQVVYLTRVCSKPAPSGEGLRCRGSNTRVRTENCCAHHTANAATQKCIGGICTESQYKLNVIALTAIAGMTLVIMIAIGYFYHRICSHRSPLHHCHC